VNPVTNGQIVLFETLGTAVLVLLGCSVVATVSLRRSTGFGAGWLVVNIGWAGGLYIGVYVAFPTGAFLNPAITVSQLMLGTIGPSKVGFYLLGEFLGAFVGAVLVWLVFKLQFDAEEDPDVILGVFATRPSIRAPGWNLLVEVVATFVLVLGILSSGGTPVRVAPLFIALLAIAVGVTLGGASGCALNPARDLAPRLAHALLRIPGKGSSDWGYAWIPIVGPIVGAVLATLLFEAVGAQSFIDEAVRNAQTP
jgi:glycerol uptake facilitator protein